MVVCAALGVLLSGVGIGLMIFDTREPGRGFILLLCGLAFLGTLIWLARQYRTMSKEQRAIYAWAIEQLGSTAGNRTPGSDLATMATARRAKDGLLTRREVQQLQDLKPENPYPAQLPTAAAPTWSGPEL
jgi:predicted lipid-binding transport protein (Tim44 family)